MTAAVIAGFHRDVIRGDSWTAMTAAVVAGFHRDVISDESAMSGASEAESANHRASSSVLCRWWIAACCFTRARTAATCGTSSTPPHRTHTHART